MKVHDIMKRFKKATGVDIFYAIEQEGILLGMGLIKSEIELLDKLNSDLSYENKIEELKSILVKQREQKEFYLSDKEVIEAIKQSLNNSIVSLTPFRKDFRYSTWLLSSNTALSILQKYDNSLNPLFYSIYGTDKNAIVKSLVKDNTIASSYFASRNGMLNGKQRYRKAIQLATPGFFHVVRANDVIANIYHPIVWRLLETNTLDVYLSTPVKNELKKYIDELISKQQLRINKIGKILTSSEYNNTKNLGKKN